MGLLFKVIVTSMDAEENPVQRAGSREIVYYIRHYLPPSQVPYLIISIRDLIIYTENSSYDRSHVVKPLMRSMINKTP